MYDAFIVVLISLVSALVSEGQTTDTCATRCVRLLQSHRRGLSTGASGRIAQVRCGAESNWRRSNQQQPQATSAATRLLRPTRPPLARCNLDRFWLR